MKDDIPFIDVGSNELGLKVKKGDKLVKGQLTGILEYGINEKTGKESNVLGFVQVKDDECYLAAIEDQLVFGWEKANDQ